MTPRLLDNLDLARAAVAQATNCMLRIDDGDLEVMHVQVQQAVADNAAVCDNARGVSEGAPPATVSGSSGVAGSSSDNILQLGKIHKQELQALGLPMDPMAYATDFSEMVQRRCPSIDGL